MIKKLGLFSAMVLSFMFFFQLEFVSAETDKDIRSNFSIFFEKESEKPIPPEDPGKPSPPKEPGKPNPLPKTGELLASFIFLLMGVALLIFAMGIFTMKKIVELDYKEAY